MKIVMIKDILFMMFTALCLGEVIVTVITLYKESSEIKLENIAQEDSELLMQPKY